MSLIYTKTPPIRHTVRVTMNFDHCIYLNLDTLTVLISSSGKVNDDENGIVFLIVAEKFQGLIVTHADEP